MPSYNNPPALSHTYDRLKGRNILVVGASSGIGEAATRLFAREGARVVTGAAVSIACPKLRRKWHILTFVLRSPFPGHRLEGVVLLDPCSRRIDFLLVGGIGAGRD